MKRILFSDSVKNDEKFGDATMVMLPAMGLENQSPNTTGT